MPVSLFRGLKNLYLPGFYFTVFVITNFWEPYIEIQQAIFSVDNSNRKKLYVILSHLII